MILPLMRRVKGHFTFKYNKLHQDVMITARMEDFQFKDHMKGWGFDTDTIFIDFSDNTIHLDLKFRGAMVPVILQTQQQHPLGKGLYP